ncbi:MFS transporter [Nocardiopsis nanhaiensis]
MLQFVIAIDVTVVNIALPSIGADLGVHTRQLTWVVVAYTITGGGLLMLGGRLADLFGRRRVLIAGTWIFGGASLLAGLAPTFEWLVAARLLQGVGEALILPAAMASIIVLFPEGPRRSKALGIWAAVASSGLVVGFVMSGVITELFGWRWIFLVTVPFIAIALVGVLAVVPAAHRPSRVPLDVAGSLLLTAAPLLFVFGVVEAGEGSGTGIGTLPLVALVAAVAAAVLLVVVERRAADPMVPLGFLRNSGRLSANAATACLSAALSTSFLLFTLYLQDRIGLSPLQAGLMLLPLAIALIAVVTFVPRVMEKAGPAVVARTGITSTALGILYFATTAWFGASAPTLIPAMLLIAVGMGFGLVGLQYAAVSGVTEENAGIASGIQRASDQLGGAVGVALYIGLGFSPLMARFGDPFITASLMATTGLVLAGLLTRGIGRAETADDEAEDATA